MALSSSLAQRILWSYMAGQIIQISMALLVAWPMENLMATVCFPDTGYFSCLLRQHGPLNSIKTSTVVGLQNQHGSRQQCRALRLAWPHGHLALGLQPGPRQHLRPLHHHSHQWSQGLWIATLILAPTGPWFQS